MIFFSCDDKFQHQNKEKPKKQKRFKFQPRKIKAKKKTEKMTNKRSSRHPLENFIGRIEVWLPSKNVDQVSYKKVYML